MSPRTSPEGLTGGANGSPERRDKARKEIQQQLRKLMADVRTQNEARRSPDGNEKRLKELADQVQRGQREVMASVALLVDPVTGQLPEDLQKEISAEFSDKQSAEFVANLINGDANRLSTDAANLGREMDGLPPIGPGGNLATQMEGRLSDLIDGFVRDRGIFSMISERTGIPEQAIAKQFQQVRPFLMGAFRGLLANIADNFKFIPGAVEFSVRARNESNWPAVLKLATNRNQAVAKIVRSRGEAQVREAWLNALTLHEQNRAMSVQTRQPFNDPLPTLESVLGLASPTSAPSPSPAPAPAPSPAPEAPRPLGTSAETIQDMQMSMVNGEFRVQKGSDTFKATAKHGNDNATVAEVTPVRPASGPVEQLTVKTRQGTTDLTKTFRAADIKTALDAQNKRVTVDNVTLEFSRV